MWLGDIKRFIAKLSGTKENEYRQEPFTAPPQEGRPMLTIPSQRPTGPPTIEEEKRKTVKLDFAFKKDNTVLEQGN